MVSRSIAKERGTSSAFGLAYHQSTSCRRRGTDSCQRSLAADEPSLLADRRHIQLVTKPRAASCPSAAGLFGWDASCVCVCVYVLCVQKPVKDPAIFHRAGNTCTVLSYRPQLHHVGLPKTTLQPAREERESTLLPQRCSPWGQELCL